MLLCCTGVLQCYDVEQVYGSAMMLNRCISVS